MLFKQILFNKKATVEDFRKLTTQQILDGFAGVPQATVSIKEVENGLGVIDALSAKTGFLKSNGEARRALKENSISVNKEKIKEGLVLQRSDLIADKFILLQRGKRNYFLLNMQ